MSSFSGPRVPVLGLALVAALAVLIHGYHLGVDDAAIYVPAIKRVADPALYPFGAEFFMSHARLSCFADLVGDSAKLSHLPVDFVIFAWHVASIMLLLLASWRLACVCFRHQRARWGAVALLAALLSVPVAGTALAIMDPYLTARSLSTPATIFAIACYLSDRRKQAVAWLLATALIHPQMSVYGAVFLGCLELAGRRLPRGPATTPVFGTLAAGLPSFLTFSPLAAPRARPCSPAPTSSCLIGPGMSGSASSPRWLCSRGSPRRLQKEPRRSSVLWRGLLCRLA